MKEKILLIWKHLKQGTLKKMWKQTLWIYQYGRRYWKAMILYTLLGLVGTGVSLVSSLISRDLVDIITGHQTGKLVSTFAAMIGFSVANILVSQASGYASTFINLKVDSEIKNDIFAKMLVTDWESLTDYHTGDLVTRWSSDASNISSGILNWIPNLIIYTFRFISALAIVLYYDPTFALFALLGIPFSALLSKPLLKRMRDNNQRSAAMNAKLYGFNQEAFSNIQTIKAFDLIHFYTEKLKSLQKDYVNMRLDFQKMSILTSVLMSIIGFIVSYSCYGWGIYRVWSNAISYGTMTMFLSLSGTLTSSVNSLVSLIPSAISLTISAGRLMDIVEMPQEDYSQDSAVRNFEKQHKSEGIGLNMQDLSYTYHNGTAVFANASIEAYPHEIVALVGPSGEGKTTMLRLILSLLTPQEGSSHICAGTDHEHMITLVLSFSLSYPYSLRKSSMLTQNIQFFITTGKHFLLSFCFLNVIIRLFRTLFLNRRIITLRRTDTMNNTTSDPVKINLEQLLREGNIIRIRPQGYSMYPLFIPERDEALIQQTDYTDCHRNDVVLYPAFQFIYKFEPVFYRIRTILPGN